ncbi:hypothetical protein R5R35_000704 [Gryllus longicercus]|uniref:UDP-glucuronosyltransferase n=1 Tax=Gryllus longicercus TaxID=2509291 RepID=A0AAN9VSH4_9ORTH
MRWLLAALVAWAAWAAPGAAALRVLGVVPVPAKSHHGVLQALLRGLAEKGHSVTSLEFFPPAPPAPDNYTSVLLDDAFMDAFKGSFNPFDMAAMPYVMRVFFLWSMGSVVGEGVLQQPAVQALARGEKGRFDVVIVESFFNEAFLGLAHIFDAPIIQVCPYVGSSWMYSATGSPSPAAYVPDPFLPFNDRMSFVQRFINFVFGVFQELGRELYYLPAQDAVMRRWLSVDARRPLPHVRDLQRATALMLVNAHVAVSYPRPLMPTLVPVGGMHVRPGKPLPEDLNKIITNARDGVIYFSMGSALQSSQMPQEKVAGILEVFASLKQVVIWKWEADTLPGKPANVEIRKWLPQNDILAHPNVKLFITHGGLLSSLEAIYHGVSLIGIPVFGDQQLNMERASLAGYAIQIPYKEFSGTTLRNALNEMFSNTRYSENAKHLSRLFRDQPETPLERAIWWIEYTSRHKGAPHLQSAAKDLSWYQYHLLDVYLVILGIVLLFVISFWWFSSFLYRILFLKQNKVTSQSQKKSKKRN